MIEQRCNLTAFGKILGILSAIVAYPFIVLSIAISPWFNLFDNALSDLGNVAQQGGTAWIYNVGLMLTGLFATLFAIIASVQHPLLRYRVWTMPLTATGIDLALIGFFPENAGRIHGLVSVIFFALIAITMLIYSYSSWPLGSPRIGALALAFGIACPIVWFVEWPWHGVAIQETITATMMAIWLILVSLNNI